MTFSRRDAMRFLAAASSLAAVRAQAAETESHGLSTFGELSLPPDFPHFPYVNPRAPKGGTLRLQIKSAMGNQNFETFDTLNVYVFKGDGAAGMQSTFDSLMTGSADEPDAAYGLLAHRVRVSDDRLSYRFLLRPEARSRRVAGERGGLRLQLPDPEGKRSSAVSHAAERDGNRRS